MSDLLTRIGRYDFIQKRILKGDEAERGKCQEASFNYAFASGKIDRGVQAAMDLTDYTGADEFMGVERLLKYALKQREILKADKTELNRHEEGSFDHSFTVGRIKRGEQVVINLYTIFQQELGDVEPVSEILE